MTNDTSHERDSEIKDMSLAAIKKRHRERQSAIKRLRESAGSAQQAREIGKQDSEEAHGDD